MKEFDILKGGITNPALASSYAAARKRLRDVRMRMIDEVENPQEMDVRDKDGNRVHTPFSVGQAPSVSPEDFFGGAVDKHRDGKQQNFTDGKRDLSDVEDSLDETIRQYLEIEGVAVSGKPGDKMAFVSEVERPQYPPMLEGESYGEWYERVRGAYLKATGATESGRAGSDSDGVRRSAADDPSNERQAPSPGGSGSGDHREDVDRDPIGNDHVGQLAAGHAGSANSTASNGAADTAATDSDT